MRPKIVVANWKMHTDLNEGLELATGVIQQLSKQKQHTVQVILLVPFTHLEAVSKLLPDKGIFFLGAQNCHKYTSGAFTGEVSAPMLHSVGAKFVLIGHSERRHLLGEDSPLLAQKITTAIACGLRPIFCCGETQSTRVLRQQENFVNEQLVTGLFHLNEAQIGQVIIAYEPVWAIGTGSTPAPDEVQAMHKALRYTIAHRYSFQIAQSIPILYGGSCNAQNASVFLSYPDVDGGLIGKASLELDSFTAIVNSLE